jgi:hypothetical protein
LLIGGIFIGRCRPDRKGRSGVAERDAVRVQARKSSRSTRLPAKLLSFLPPSRRKRENRPVIDTKDEGPAETRRVLQFTFSG